MKDKDVKLGGGEILSNSYSRVDLVAAETFAAEIEQILDTYYEEEMDNDSPYSSNGTKSTSSADLPTLSSHRDLPHHSSSNDPGSSSPLRSRKSIRSSKSISSADLLTLSSSGLSQDDHEVTQIHETMLRAEVQPQTRVFSPDDFEVIQLLGKGDVGTVYLAKQKDTGELFAMKILDKMTMFKRDKIKRVLTERDILASVHHPFIVSLHHCFQTEDKIYFIMDFCAGGDMYNMLKTRPGKRFDEDTARFYAAEVLLALEYLHLCGYIYRDLKPENVLFNKTGHIELTDFDLSIYGGHQVIPTLIQQENGDIIMDTEPDVVSNEFVGTEEYLAPEVILGDNYSSEVDWWEYGILLYEMVYGMSPFRGITKNDTFHHILHYGVQFPEEPEVSKKCKSLIKQLLHPDPAKRLGYNYGAADIKTHEFFKHINWSLIRNEVPPIVPDSHACLDCSYFPPVKSQGSDNSEIKRLSSASSKLLNSSFDDFKVFDRS